jgi:hypothetical protein
MIRVAVIFLVLLVAGCSPQIRVYSDMDPDYDLWTYTSFDWGQQVDIEAGRNPLRYNELNDKRIKAAVAQEMSSRGYTFRTGDSDLIIHYHIVVDEKSVVVPETFGYRYGPYWTRTGANVYHYREGTLILDVMERKTTNLIWRGWGVANIDEIDPQGVDQVVRRAVQKIFQRFPQKSVKQNVKEVVSN